MTMNAKFNAEELDHLLSETILSETNANKNAPTTKLYEELDELQLESVVGASRAETSLGFKPPGGTLERKTSP